ncbi:MAG TPA: rod shape-determining protein MreD [Geminicoccaceae bacterium]|nr:rod shape-determining protein MreD [Geminicoccus sp.]HMU53118.1 rod shape-determining protein MreD [Geminicoccaceae bacterium]
MIQDSLVGSLGTALRRSTPFLTAVAAVLVDLLPLPDAAPLALAPFTTVAVVFFWSVHRPDLMTPLAAVAAGLLFDALAGLPLGLTGLALLFTRALGATPDPILHDRPPLLVWGSFVLVAAGAVLLRWIVASLWSMQLFELRPVLFELGLTVAVYPLVAALLGRIDLAVLGRRHAARG